MPGPPAGSPPPRDVAGEVRDAVDAMDDASEAPPGRMIRTLFAASSRGETGVFFVEAPSATSRLEIERGWVHAMANVARAPSGEEMLGRLFDRVPAAQTGGRFEPRAEGAALAGHRVTPFHPGRVVRAHVDKLRDQRLLALRDFTGARMRVRIAPHGSSLDAHEQRVVALLATPRRLDELLPISPRVHLERLLSFLDAVGALVVEDAAIADAYATLGVADGASTEEVKRAYHRLARDLHPDLHPDAGDDRRRALVERFHAVSAAYRRLLPGS